MLISHELKTDSEPFERSLARIKPWEIRLNDRSYCVGDYIKLRETRYSGDEMKAGKPLEYTGREIVGKITYIMEGPIYGLQDNWVIFTYDEYIKI